MNLNKECKGISIADVQRAIGKNILEELKEMYFDGCDEVSYDKEMNHGQFINRLFRFFALEVERNIEKNGYGNYQWKLISRIHDWRKYLNANEWKNLPMDEKVYPFYCAVIKAKNEDWDD